MRFLLLTFLISITLYAQNYMAKIEPIQSYNIFAQSSGEIIWLDTNNEHSLLNGTLLRIDKELETIKRNTYVEQRKIYSQQLSIKQGAYSKAKRIKAKSLTELNVLHMIVLDLKF